MKKSIEKFLEFNGKAVSFLNVDGQWWVALKPICEALSVDYNRQFQNLKTDEILGQLFADQQMVAADGRLRKMVCLPEKFIYGWLFSIRSDSPGLIEFKQQCYEVLFDHFHGGITGQMKINKLRNTVEIEQLNKKFEERMLNDPDRRKIKELESANLKLGKDIARLEKAQESDQLDLFRRQFDNN